MKLKIFVLNCWLLPPPFSIANRKRLLKIVSLIKKHNPDIIALQEIWLKKYVRFLKNNLSEYSFVKSKSKPFNKSGLVTGLKINYDSFKVKYFPRGGHNLVENLGKKGFHIVKLTENLFFVNTHLYAPTDIKEKSITKFQFNFLKNLIPTKKIIIAGDLNLSEDELKELNGRFEHDESAESTLSNSNHLSNKRFNNYEEIDKKADYVLCTKGNSTISTKCIKSPIVSDHFALISNISFK